MTANSKRINTTEKAMIITAAVAVIIALLLRYPAYALGVILSTPVAWLLYRWQMAALAKLQGVSQPRATSMLLTRSILRLIIQLTLLGLSMLAGTVFLFGVLTGFLLQVIAYTGQAIYTTFKKGGKA